MKESSTRGSHPNIAEVARILTTVLPIFGQSRKIHDLSAEDLLIFLTIGYQSLENSNYGLIVNTTTCVDIGKLLGIPRETVRRRVIRLAEMNLVESSTRGIRLLDLEMWRSITLKFA